MIEYLYASHQFSIKVMCRLFQVLRSSYYAFKSHQPSQRDQENKLLKKEIMISYLDSSKRYGAPKIHKDLLEKGYYISEKRVQKLMNELNIRIPEDVSLIGIDALPSFLTGGIDMTSIRVPHTERAYWAIQLLLKEIEHPVKEKCKLYPHT